MSLAFLYNLFLITISQLHFSKINFTKNINRNLIESLSEKSESTQE